VEIPKNVKRRLRFVAVTSMDEVLSEALARSPFTGAKKVSPPKGRLGNRRRPTPVV
jgi:hypothetical protein